MLCYCFGFAFTLKMANQVMLKLTEGELETQFGKVLRRKLKRTNRLGCKEVVGGCRTAPTLDEPRGGYPAQRVTATSLQKQHRSKENSKVLALHTVVYFYYYKKIADTSKKEAISRLCHKKTCINHTHT